MKPYTTLHTLCASLIALLCALFAPPQRAQAQEAYVHQSTDKATLTFFYDTQRSSREGTTWSINDQKKGYDTMIPAWANLIEGEDSEWNTLTTKAVFDASFKDFRPTTTSYWFSGFKVLQTIEGLENLNTSEVINMSYMFTDCPALTTLDLKNFNTKNVTNMSSMFSSCFGLKNIDLSHFQTENVTDMSWMFYHCRALKELDLSNFNTKNVTDMSELFAGCVNLRSIDFSNFNTEKVNDMNSMFTYCVALTSLDLKNFNTKNVTDMSEMFSYCTNLQNINLSSFNTQQVKDIIAMFHKCGKLEVLDLSNFKVDKETKAVWLFKDCTALTTIYNSDTWQCKESEDMFAGCTKLQGAVKHDASKVDVAMANPETGYFTVKPEAYVHQSTDKATLTFFYDTQRSSRDGTTWGINDQKKGYDTMVPAWVGTIDSYDNTIKKAVFDPSFKDFRPTTTASWLQCLQALETVEGLENLNTSQVTSMRRMFHGAQALKSIDLSHFQTENVTDMSWLFYECQELKELDLSNFNTEKVTNMSEIFNRCSNLSSLNISSFNTSQVSNMTRIFYGCSALTKLDLTMFNTEKVTTMIEMFSYCTSLQDINLSSFNTQQVKKMIAMFHKCGKLKVLDLSNFKVDKETEAVWLFKDCAALTTIYNSDTWQCKESKDMFAGCTKLQGAVKHDASKVDVAMANPETGYFTIKTEAYAQMSADEKTLTFFYDKLRSSRKELTWGINDQNSDDTPAWTPEVGEENETTTKVVFDTSLKNFRPTSTNGWLLNYTVLTTIEGWENLNTSEVTDMEAMFKGCKSLKEIDLSHFDTKKVENMLSLFAGCSALTAIDLSNFNTENVKDMGWLFGECSALTAIDLSNFNTAEVKYMTSMFAGCESLKEIKISNFNTEKVEVMGGMFKRCKSLTSLNLSHFNTEKVKDMGSMFEDCTMLEWVDLTNVLMPFHSTTSHMFKNCVNLTTIFCDNSWSSKYGADLFNNCPKLKGAVAYDETQTDVTMANSNTGYFTKKPTAIESLLLPALHGRGIYTLQGKRVNGDFQHLPAGVYIVNGKKVVVRH